MPEQPVKAAPGQQRIDGNEDCQRDHEPEGDRRHESAQEHQIRIAFDPPARACGPHEIGAKRFSIRPTLAQCLDFLRLCSRPAPLREHGAKRTCRSCSLGRISRRGIAKRPRQSGEQIASPSLAIAGASVACVESRFSADRSLAQLRDAATALRQAFVRGFGSSLTTGKRRPELFAQGTLVTSQSGGPAGTGEVAEVDEKLPAKATSCEGRGLGKERRKQHHRNPIPTRIANDELRNATAS